MSGCGSPSAFTRLKVHALTVCLPRMLQHQPCLVHIRPTDVHDETGAPAIGCRRGASPRNNGPGLPYRGQPSTSAPRLSDVTATSHRGLSSTPKKLCQPYVADAEEIAAVTAFEASGDGKSIRSNAKSCWMKQGKYSRARS